MAEWLEPDWVLDMAVGQLTRRRLRRPTIELEIHRCGHQAWQLFKRHHYLSGSLAVGARCYLTTWARHPREFLRNAAHDHQAKPPPLHADRHAPRLPGNRHRHAGRGGRGRVASRRGSADQRHQQPPGADPALPPLAAVENRPTCVQPVPPADKTRGCRDYRSAAGRAVVSFEYVGKVSGVNV